MGTPFGVWRGSMPRRGVPFPEKDYLEHILARWSDSLRSCRKPWRTVMSEKKISMALVNTPTRRQLIAGVAIALGGVALGSTGAWAGAEEEILHTAESIH